MRNILTAPYVELISDSVISIGNEARLHQVETQDDIWWNGALFIILNTNALRGIYELPLREFHCLSLNAAWNSLTSASTFKISYQQHKIGSVSLLCLIPSSCVPGVRRRTER